MEPMIALCGKFVKIMTQKCDYDLTDSRFQLSKCKAKHAFKRSWQRKQENTKEKQKRKKERKWPFHNMMSAGIRV